MYSDSDIKIIKGDDHILNHQGNYFGSKKANPEAICSGIAQAAMLLGCVDVAVQKFDNWWLVSGEVDWLKQPNQIQITDTEVFTSLRAFPEAGDNWFRSEYLAVVFSSALVTFDGNSSKVIKGNKSNLMQFNKLTSELESKKRIIGFIFEKSI